MVQHTVRALQAGARSGDAVARLARGVSLLCALVFAIPSTGDAQPAFTGSSQATLLTDIGGDGQPSIGDTVEVMLDVTNSGPADATGATLTLTIDPYAQLVSESINVSPIVRGDSYVVVGNVSRALTASVGVLANDVDVDSDELEVTAYDPFTLRGGSVQMNANGSFNYIPPVGVSGTVDEFGYTVTDSRGLSSSGKVSLSLSGRVWFVDSRVANSGDGSSGSPFKTLAPFLSGSRPDSAGDYILLRSGGTPYGGGVSLLSEETLVGDFSGLTVSGQSIVPVSGVRPLIQSSSGSAVILGSGSGIRALAIEAAGSDAVSGNALTGAVSLQSLRITGSGSTHGLRLTSSAASVAVSDVHVTLSGTGTGLIADGLSGAVTLSSTVLTVTTGRAFDILNQSGGSFAMSGSSSSSTTNGGAVRVANITGGTISLSGIAATTTGGAPALTLQGTVSSLQISNSSFAGTGTSPLVATALQGSVMMDQTSISSDRTIDLSGISGGTFSFGDLSVNPASGEALRLVGTSGAVQIDSLNAQMSASAAPAVLVQNNIGSAEISGGLIAGFSGAPAVSLLNAESVTLADLTIDGDFAGVANGIEADSVDGMILSNVEIREIGDNNGLTSAAGTETALLLSHLSGTVALEAGTSIHDIGRDAIAIDNNVGNDTTGEALSFTLDTATVTDVGEFTLLLDTFQNDTTDIAIIGTLIQDVGNATLRAVTLQYSGSGANSLTVESSVVHDTGNGNIFVRAQDLAAVDVVIDSSSFDGTTSEAVFLRAMGQGGAPAQSRSNIRARIESCSFGAGIGLEGIYADVEDDGGNLEVALLSNTDLGTGAGLSTVQASTGAARVCGRITGNTSPTNPGLNAVNGGTFVLEGFGGGGAAAAEAFLGGVNPGLSVFTAGAFSGGGPCVTP